MTQSDFPYLRLRLSLRPLSNRTRSSPCSSRGNPLPATQLRRVLGKAFVDLLCPFGRPRCQDWPSLRGAKGRAKAHELCPQARQCAYGVYFAASDSLRPPFALFVRPDPADGGAQQIEVTLFGSSWRLYPWMVGGLARALDGGIGKQRGRWRIESVAQVVPGGARRLCGGDLASLPTALQPDSIPLSRATLLESFESCRQPSLEVRLLSPTRLLHDGRVLTGAAPVPLSLLVARTLDRLHGLYGDRTRQLLPQELEPLLDREAGRVPVVRARTRWVAQKDYSARFRREIRLDGKMGDLVYGQGAERFLPILKAGEILHVGKNVTSGCGRIAVVG